VVKRVLALGVVLGLIVVGVIAYSFLKEPEAASGPIEAIPVVVDQSSSTEPTQASDSAEPEATIAPTATAESAATESSIADATATSAPEAAAVPTAGAAGSNPVSDGTPTVFEIVQADSEARFIIGEVLNGTPKTVVGTTDQVAGEIAIFPDDPASSKIGTILVNARALSTDNDFRNRAIKNRILSTNDYEFVSFEPTDVVGMPDSVSIGESFDFQIIGDLTVRDVTNEVTFDATVTPVSETRLEGVASATILYADFDLGIPSAMQVASVEDEVLLEIEFAAVAQ
jgi:polyisoprenoid-binding protein YceI